MAMTTKPREASVESAGEVPAAPAARPSLSNVDSRTVLAASGFFMLGFVVVHLGGNLLAFAGSAAFDAYARTLRELGSPFVGPGVLLTLARVVLAAALVTHLGTHAWITLRPLFSPSEGAQARLSFARLLVDSFTGKQPARAGGQGPSPAEYVPAPPAYAAHPLLILFPSGAAILVFVALHLAQLTLGATVPGFDPAHPYRNLIIALRSGPVALAYLAAVVAVGAHLLPGVWSGMRSLRLIRPRTEGLARTLAPLIALGTALGLAAVPVAVLLGVLH